MLSSDSPGVSFAPSAELSLGVELELQIVDPKTGDLAPLCGDILTSIRRMFPPERGSIVAEITSGMIEISTGVCRDASEVLVDLQALKMRVESAAVQCGALISGGGTHPFQRWADQRIYDSPRFLELSDLYGSLLKQFTVFGQHIHLGCSDVARVPLLMHQLAHYVPHFIALSASSPFLDGSDSGYDSSRLTRPSPFPTGVHAPFTLSWTELTEYFAKCVSSGVIESAKDLHWDIRPKPEFGTVEIRVLDSPLTLTRAAALASFAQVLGSWLLNDTPFMPHRDDYIVYAHNKFQAARFGLNAAYIDPRSGRCVRLLDHLRTTLHGLSAHAEDFGACDAIDKLMRVAETGENDAAVLRRCYDEVHSFRDVVLASAAALQDPCICIS
ncbi:carboxylate-amine ligase [Variovorax paradoxus]|uniref:YbdK family carboxylate-amine ligase n=1 Tax=Variovorax paradoxus TaxID=34073 RepID=UPI00278EB4A7|nr:YbdK family carboxylate-amine ligase [Variovorax paradoxus]MDQ0569988.1 carboxylate-amine ligase [Variovorax paradoxus]